MKPTKTEVRVARCAERIAEWERLATEIGVGQGFVTRRGLAAVLKVSVRTVDEMIAAKEITPVRVRGLVRFYLPQVVRELTAAAVARVRTTGLRTTDYETEESQGEQPQMDTNGHGFEPLNTRNTRKGGSK